MLVISFSRIDVYLLLLLFVLMYACYFFIRIDVCLLFLLVVLTYA